MYLGSSSGLTTTNKWLKIKDDDRKTLVKFIDEYHLSKRDVDLDYKEFNAQGSGSSDRMKKSQWWAEFFKDKEFNEAQEQKHWDDLKTIVSMVMVLAPEISASLRALRSTEERRGIFISLHK